MSHRLESWHNIIGFLCIASLPASRYGFLVGRWRVGPFCWRLFVWPRSVRCVQVRHYIFDWRVCWYCRYAAVAVSLCILEIYDRFWGSILIFDNLIRWCWWRFVHSADFSFFPTQYHLRHHPVTACCLWRRHRVCEYQFQTSTTSGCLQLVCMGCNCDYGVFQAILIQSISPTLPKHLSTVSGFHLIRSPSHLLVVRLVFASHWLYEFWWFRLTKYTATRI